MARIARMGAKGRPSPIPLPPSASSASSASSAVNARPSLPSASSMPVTPISPASDQLRDGRSPARDCRNGPTAGHSRRAPRPRYSPRAAIPSCRGYSVPSGEPVIERTAAGADSADGGERVAIRHPASAIRFIRVIRGQRSSVPALRSQDHGVAAIGGLRRWAWPAQQPEHGGHEGTEVTEKVTNGAVLRVLPRFSVNSVFRWLRCLPNRVYGVAATGVSSAPSAVRFLFRAIHQAMPSARRRHKPAPRRARGRAMRRVSPTRIRVAWSPAPGS